MSEGHGITAHAQVIFKRQLNAVKIGVIYSGVRLGEKNKHKNENPDWHWCANSNIDSLNWHSMLAAAKNFKSFRKRN
jgi:hypothetical protein